MRVTRPFFTLLCLTILEVLTPVRCVISYSFSRYKILDGSMCPVNHTIQDISYVSKRQCLALCADDLSCNGVFLELDEMRCVVCSARYFTKDYTQNSTFTFYQQSKLRMKVGLGAVRMGLSVISVYQLIFQDLTWDEAKQNCEELNGYLVSINSAEENEHIMQHVVNDVSDGVWIGGQGTGGDAGSFTWEDGSFVVFEYTNWYGTQPYPISADRQCIAMFQGWDFQWDDVDCMHKMDSVCEFHQKLVPD